MTTDPRAALDRLVAALEAHLQAASRRHGEVDVAVVGAYQTLADAFETYDEALYTAYDEVTPFVLYDDAEDAEDDDEDEEEDDDLDDLDDDDEDGLSVQADVDDDVDDDAEEEVGDDVEQVIDQHVERGVDLSHR